MTSQTARPSTRTHSRETISVKHCRSPRTHSSGSGVPVAVAVAVAEVVVTTSVEIRVVVSMVVEGSTAVVEKVTDVVGSVTMLLMYVVVEKPNEVVEGTPEVVAGLPVVVTDLVKEGPGLPLVQRPSSQIVPGGHAVSGPQIALPSGPTIQARLDVSVTHCTLPRTHSSGGGVGVGVGLTLVMLVTVVVVVSVSVADELVSVVVTVVVSVFVGVGLAVVVVSVLVVVVVVSVLVMVSVSITVLEPGTKLDVLSMMVVVIGPAVPVPRVIVVVGLGPAVVEPMMVRVGLNVGTVVEKVNVLGPGLPLEQIPSKQVVPAGHSVAGPQMEFPDGPIRHTRFDVSVTHSCVPRMHSSGGNVAVGLEVNVLVVVDVGGPGSHCPFSSLHSKPDGHS